MVFIQNCFEWKKMSMKVESNILRGNLSKSSLALGTVMAGTKSWYIWTKRFHIHITSMSAPWIN